jgi:hypothetical protein
LLCVERKLADKLLRLNGSEATTGVPLYNKTSTQTTKQLFPNLETVVLQPLILEVKLLQQGKGLFWWLVLHFFRQYVEFFGQLLWLL